MASLASAQPVDLDLLSFDPIATGIVAPTSITHAGDGTGRLYIAQQTGQVLVWENGGIRATPFLDVSALISCCAEQGLLSIVFHPNYPTDDRFWIAYTDKENRIVVTQGRSADGLVATDTPLVPLFEIGKPAVNHNGGQLQFGPDGMLYIATGDGGNGGDPFNFAQNLTLLLGKILRVDVDGPSTDPPYDIPDNNPYVGHAQNRPEIWHYGLRNPWRFSFDRLTGDMLIGDVGQGAVEEIDFAAAGTGNLNFGWRPMEGSQCFNPSVNCFQSSFVLPILEYNHDPDRGRSVTGGYVYRGSAIPLLQGYYFYADWITRELFAATGSGNNWTLIDTRLTDSQITTFGEDEAGEIYFADSAGSIYKITGAALDPCEGVTATPLSFSLSSDAQSVDVAVETPTESCSWTASTTAPWLTFTDSGPISGDGTLSVNVASNSGGSARSGEVTINGTTVTVNQDSGVNCFPVLSETSRYFDKSSRTLRTVSIQVPGVCGWTATPADPWVSITAGGSQTGPGDLTFAITENTSGAERRTTVNFTLGAQLEIIQRGTLTQFADVTPDNFAFDGASQMRTRALTDGCATNPLRFCPGAYVTRGQIAVFVIRAALGTDEFEFPSEPYFADVPPTHPFFKWIQKFRELGYTNGCSDTGFCPGDYATREQIAVFLIRLRLGPGVEFEFPAGAIFPDVPDANIFFRWIQKLSELQITGGCGGGNYCPKNKVTRAQMALFIIRAAYNELLPD